ANRTLVDTVLHWSPTLVQECYTTYEENFCVSASLYLLSALALLASCSLGLYQRCKTRGKNRSDEAICGLYCFVGNLCGAVGAFLSNQYDFQISMASFMAILDGVNFLSASFAIYLWLKSKTGKKLRMLSRRKRQNLLAVPLMFLMVTWVYMGLPAPSNTDPKPSNMRKLFGVFLSDYTENLGYVLGLLSFAISWTSRLPLILKANGGEQRSTVEVSSRLLSAGAGALYGAAILLYNTQLSSVVKAMPWILSAISSSILDLSIVSLVCYRSRHRRPSVRNLDSDTESLLGNTSIKSQLYNNNHSCRKKHCLHSSRGISPKGTDMGLYMDVNIQPMRKVCLKEVTVLREGLSEGLPLKRTVKVVRVDEPCSSGTSSDSSLGSELEV
ncbi:hypothetical protein DNTS_028717, partial [Danionella cerebrum]